MVRAQAIYEDNLHTHIKALFAPRLQQICSALMDAGALGAKFSGAGGEGSVIALASSAGQAEALGEVFAGQNLPCWSVLLQPTNTA
jgi:mevalonate kinase